MTIVVTAPVEFAAGGSQSVSQPHGGEIDNAETSRNLTRAGSGAKANPPRD